MSRLALLGSTGSIGVQTLDVLEQLGPEWRPVALAAGQNTELLAAQAHRWRPALVSVSDDAAAARLAGQLPAGCRVAVGDEGLCEVATAEGAELVVAAVTGAVGLRPIVAALESGRRVAPANKEPLVVAGELLMGLSAARNLPLVPIDSEHSAIFQCLRGEDPRTVERLILTASGGPFRGWTSDQLASVTPEQALRHPTWSMGPKITIDSATLFNKGLEVIEARWLFGLGVERIDVVLHPQSLVHSMVEYVDGSILAQMDHPDMRTPIQYALTYPQRLPSPRPRLDLTTRGSLTFEPPDRATFRCLDLAYEAAARGGAVPCAMNAADEVAVAAFLAGEIAFLDIPRVIERVMARADDTAGASLEALLAADEEARVWAQEECQSCQS